MNKDIENIDIRSQKVRDIIGQEPPWFIRYGTITIALMLVLFAVVIAAVYK